MREPLEHDLPFLVELTFTSVFAGRRERLALRCRTRDEADARARELEANHAADAEPALVAVYELLAVGGGAASKGGSDG